MCKVKVNILPREKEWKERKSMRRVSVSSSGFQPRVRKVRRWATSVMSPPNFRKISNILLSMSVDNLKHPKNWQISIKRVWSASTIERTLQRASTREESIRPRASCGWSTEARHTVWLCCNDQTLPTVIRLRWSTTGTKVMYSEHITVKMFTVEVWISNLNAY